MAITASSIFTLFSQELLEMRKNLKKIMSEMGITV